MRINYIDKDDITKQEFEAYVLVQMSGQYNMIMDARDAMDDAGLDQDTYFSIIKNYGYLKNKFGKSMNLEEAKQILNKNGYLLEDINDVINHNAYGDGNVYGNLNKDYKQTYDRSEYHVKNSNRLGYEEFFEDYIKNNYDVTIDNDSTFRFSDKNSMNKLIQFIVNNTKGKITEDDFVLGRVKCTCNYYISYIVKLLMESGEFDEIYSKYCHRNDRYDIDSKSNEIKRMLAFSTGKKNTLNRLNDLCTKLADIIQTKIHRNCEVNFQRETDGTINFSVFPNNGFDRSKYKGLQSSLNKIANKYNILDENGLFNRDAATNLINDFARAIGA